LATGSGRNPPDICIWSLKKKVWRSISPSHRYARPEGKNIDFWGFCLCDGRRIGKGGLELYETLGKQLLPLSKQKLKNLIGDGDNWAETPGAYKQLVNDRVFRFRDIRQYDQLIQLLIKVRTPKLSKEAFRPTAVKTVLKDSLQVLTDEDLSAMVSTMERMDALEDTLRDYQTAMRDASIIRNEYTRYNQYMLGKKGQAYLEALDKAARLKAQAGTQQDKLTVQEAELEACIRAKEEAASRLAQAKIQREAMGEDDLTAQRRVWNGRRRTASATNCSSTKERPVCRNSRHRYMTARSS
jgi:hypothetical protein